MPSLAAKDADAVLRFVAEAEELGGDAAFTPEVLVELGKLVEADWVGYCEQDRVRKNVRLSVDRPGDEYALPRETSYWDIADEHPVCKHHNGHTFGALKISDFMTASKLHGSRVYALWFRPAGVEHELNVAIPSPPWHTKTFLFDRAPGPDFTERDRLVLNMLQPHLVLLWRAAQMRRRLNVAMAALERLVEDDGRGVLLLASDGRVDFASPVARRLIEAYFGPIRDATLPRTLTDWIDSGSTTLVERRGASSLTVDRSDDAVLFSEATDEVDLTPRERQILAWVARGKTNPEIAELLWVAPSTVRKHLQNVYAKLGVRTRTAAAARFLGMLDGDEAQA